MQRHLLLLYLHRFVDISGNRLFLCTARRIFKNDVPEILPRKSTDRKTRKGILHLVNGRYRVLDNLVFPRYSILTLNRIIGNRRWYSLPEKFRRYSQSFCDLLSNLFRKSATNSIFKSLVVNKVSAGGFIWQDAVKTSESAAMDGGKADISKAVLRTESPAGAMYMGRLIPK